MIIMMTMMVMCRTHTLLLIDKAGRCEYIEETLIYDALNADHNSSSTDNNVPPVTGKQQYTWNTTQHTFNLQ